MRRKPFIISAAVVALGLPAAYYYRKNKWFNNSPLTLPVMLSSFCDEKTIVQIGETYRILVPAENTKQKLKELILTNDKGMSVNINDYEKIASLIDTKIREEFSLSHTIIIKGWIISITEARQCALLTLSK